MNKEPPCARKPSLCNAKVIKIHSVYSHMSCRALTDWLPRFTAVWRCSPADPALCAEPYRQSFEALEARRAGRMVVILAASLTLESIGSCIE